MDKAEDLELAENRIVRARSNRRRKILYFHDGHIRTRLTGSFARSFDRSSVPRKSRRTEHCSNVAKRDVVLRSLMNA
jgi:hypothetical protein